VGNGCDVVPDGLVFHSGPFKAQAMLTRILRSAAVGAMVLAASCDGEMTAPRTPVEAAGTYVLASVSGRGPTSGSITLYPDGKADRRVQYAPSGGAAQSWEMGTYEMDVQGITFTLREATAASSVWSWLVRGQWVGSGFSISYPDPADGPDIVETYRRL
jgi:hypothetical protein